MKMTLRLGIGLLLLATAAQAAVIDNGSTSSQQDVTNEAARVYLANSSGTEISGGAPTGSYAIASGVLRQTGATAAASSIISFRNNSTKSMRIRRISLTVSFDGTAAATTSSFRIRKFDTATMSGGTAASLPADVYEMQTSYPNSTLLDFRWGAAALTTTSVVFYGYLGQAGVSRGVTGASQRFVWDYTATNSASGYPTLAASEGIAVVVDTTCVIGDAVGMSVEWDEF